MKILCAAMVAAAMLLGQTAFAQDKSADNMQIVLEKIRADKKLLVASNMEISAQEAAGFWPVYDAYQKDLEKINDRIKKTIESYANSYNQGAVSDEMAKKLIEEVHSIEASEVELKRSYVSKFAKVLPMAKVARYYQIESKMRAAIKYELAKSIPLVK